MANNQSQREMRFDALITLLCWEGELRNSRLQDLLNLASVQVSRLIRHLREAYPGLLINDTTSKRWVLADRSRLPSTPNIDAYLRFTEDNDSSASEWLVDSRLSFASPDPLIFANVRAACVSSRGLQVNYRSMSSPEGKLRLIFPHSMIRLGRRWHVRAWCCERQDYRDFNLGRMRDLLMTDTQADHENPKDHAWHTWVDLHIGAHRDLSPAHQILIKEEYFGGKDSQILSARAPLTPYLIQDLQVATDPATETPPAFQLELLNAKDMKSFAFGSS